jgi:uncharacterized RDD family membrane protein YckC
MKVTAVERGSYAGVASRTTAVVIDIVLIVISYWLAVSMVTLVWAVINLDAPDFPSFDNTTWGWLYLSWAFLYVWGCWTLFGKTPGKAILGVRIVTKNGGRLGPIRAFVRLIGYGVSCLFFFAGFWWVLIDRRRRGWSDLIAGTCVVYDWNARPGALFEARRELAGRG